MIEYYENASVYICTECGHMIIVTQWVQPPNKCPKCGKGEKKVK